ncbi:MAG: efflux RND transporter permease subunit, partial [Bacteroides sp.]
MINRIIRYFLENRVITLLLFALLVLWGISTAPFSWNTTLIPRDPVPVDAIPDTGDNQQIIATEWMGRSPKDVQDQITYPLTTALLGIPGVKTIRSTSMFGMSFIYVIFSDNIEFYWSRSRILEKLNSLPSGTLPDGVQPALGPDATALGQIYWYTLEGRNPKTGRPNGGWSPEELRTIQDFYVKYTLSSAEGVSEIGSVGGFVKEYQIELKPEALYRSNLSIMDVMNAIKKSNLDIGAETLEINKVEYLIRGLGYVKNIADIEHSVVAVRNNVPIRIGDIAYVNVGPATRRGGLDKEGVEAVGGVVVARYGSNPLAVIDNVKQKIKDIEASLPQKTLSDGTTSKVSIVPFYDRTTLIKETIGTLETSLSHEILICIIVIIVLVFNLRASVIIAGMLPIAVLTTFILMRYTHVDANIVALSGIAIAIGVMVDVGVVFVENIIRHMEMPENKTIRKGKALRLLIYNATSEVSGAIVTAMLTTIVSFIPVFALQAQEGKMFSPLAFTKTYALAATFILGIILLPTLAHLIFSIRINFNPIKKGINVLLILLGLSLSIIYASIPALGLTAIGLNNLLAPYYKKAQMNNYINIGITLFIAIYYLATEWLPVGPQEGLPMNFLFVSIAVGLILILLWTLVIFYEKILRWCLANRWKFMLIPVITIISGFLIWRNVGQEFMPTLNEGSFLLMPTSMPHTGVEQNLEYVKTLDKRLKAIPEIETAVGKWGRVNSALDPAPIQMFENTINYRSEFILDDNGHRMRFKVNKDDEFILKSGKTYSPEQGFRLIPKDSLIEDQRGNYFRQWRPEIKTTNDIWQEIVNVTHIPGLTSAPKLQPIEARLVMLSTGMRAPMGIKVYGPTLEDIEQGGKALEKALKEIPSIIPSSVFYDRAVGAPYLEIKLNREKMGRYGVSVSDLQEVLSAAVGGMPLTRTVEGRERFSIRLRYARELRDQPEELKQLLVPISNGTQVPLSELVDIGYSKGAQMIQSENTFLLGYVIFDKLADKAEVDVVKEADKIIKDQLRSGQLTLPKGVSYQFAGNYEQQQRATNR